MNVLIVDDDPLARERLSRMVGELEGYSVLEPSATNGEEALALIDSHKPDIVLLDIRMPGLDGLQLCRAIRADANTAAIPIIMLTAKGEESDRIIGLELGADDYITKPFSPNEVVARIQALLRRARGLANQPQLQAAGLHLDESRQCVSRGEQEIELTAAEFRLLRYLMLHAGQILSKSHLAEHLYDGETERDSNVIEVHVNHLRRKLGPSHDGLITTVRGVGYRIDR